MPNFRKSEEGVKAYQQLGLQYPTLASDLIYEDFLKVTKRYELNRTLLTSVIRVQSQFVNEEQNPGIDD